MLFGGSKPYRLGANLALKQLIVSGSSRTLGEIPEQEPRGAAKETLGPGHLRVTGKTSKEPVPRGGRRRGSGFGERNTEVISQGDVLATSSSLSRAEAERPKLQPLSPEGVRIYRLNLAMAALDVGNQPANVALGGEEGRVVVEIQATGANLKPEVSVLESSGVAEFDQRAIAMMKYAVGVAELPGAMRGRPFRLEVPVEFSPTK